MAAIAGHLPAEVALAALGFPIEDAPTVKRLSDRCVALLSGVLPRYGRGAAIGAALGLYAYSGARFAQAVYVLHAFQKKSRSGIKTPKDDVDDIWTSKISTRSYATRR
jgi:cytochrome P450